jgi:hypothetical protein
MSAVIFIPFVSILREKEKAIVDFLKVKKNDITFSIDTYDD